MFDPFISRPSYVTDEMSKRAVQGSNIDADLISLLYSNIHTSVQVLQAVDKSETRHEHHLALLAVETTKLLRKDSSMFMPVLSKRHPQAIIFSASLLHKLYGHKLVS